MSDRDVAIGVCEAVEREFALRFGVSAFDAVRGRLPEEMALKAEVLFATRARFAAEPDYRLPDSAGFDRIAAEVLAHLRGLPEKRASFRELPRIRADAATRIPQPEPEPEPAIRGATGAYAWLLGLAVLTVMAMSIWL